MNLVLLEVEKLLPANQRSLKDYSMPYPENANLLTHANNHLILSELNFNNEELRSEFLNLFSQMTSLFTVLTCLPFFPPLCFSLEFQPVIKTRTIFMPTNQQAKIYNQIIKLKDQMLEIKIKKTKIII